MAKRGVKTEIDIEKLTELCENGSSVASICQELNISDRTLYRKAKENVIIADLLKDRTEQQEVNIVEKAKNKLIELLDCDDLNVVSRMVIFVLKTKGKWVEDKNIEPEETKDREITIRLVDAKL